MRILDILKQRERGISFEFFPARSPEAEKSLAATVKALTAYKPMYMSMTCGAGGGKQGRTQEAVCMLLKEKGMVVMPHVTSVDITQNSMRELLNSYKESGIENLMVLRGDPPQGVANFDFSRQEFSYASDLVRFIRSEYGEYFCMGVAVYPEGHLETSTLEEDMKYTKQKVQMGADFAVTQMFFDNLYYYFLVDRMRKEGLSLPVLPGILPLRDISIVKKFASICRATIPPHIEEAMTRYEGKPKEMEKVGLEFTIQQCRDLIQNGVKRMHFYTLNKLEAITTVLDAIGFSRN